MNLPHPTRQNIYRVLNWHSLFSSFVKYFDLLKMNIITREPKVMPEVTGTQPDACRKSWAHGLFSLYVVPEVLDRLVWHSFAPVSWWVRLLRPSVKEAVVNLVCILAVVLIGWKLLFHRELSLEKKKESRLGSKRFWWIFGEIVQSFQSKILRAINATTAQLFVFAAAVQSFNITIQ